VLGSARSVLVKYKAPAFPAPVAAYGFSEGSGTTSADSSGNGHTLSIVNASWATGHTGSGLSNSTSDVIGATTNSFSNSSHLTLMAWVLPQDLTTGSTRFAFGFVQSNGFTDAALFAQRNAFGPNVLQADLRINGGVVAANGNLPLTVGTWVHIAITYDGSNMVLYRDGSPDATFAITGTVDVNNSPLYVVGAPVDAGYTSPDMAIDDVRIFNVALTQAQIVAAMNTPV
jgi:hypothetical protein